MVNVRCVTNLDEYKVLRWPTEMEARPVVGDYIRSYDGKELKITRITHATYDGCAIDAIGGHEKHPYLEIYIDK